MQMSVWTQHPNHFIREVLQLLHSKGYTSVQIDDLLDAQFDGEVVTWKRLSHVQFIAIEDMAARRGFVYNGCQEE